MRDYVVQSGPLRTLDQIYDNRFDKLKHVGDFHTIWIISRPGTQRRVMGAMNRSSATEVVFVNDLFSGLAQGARTMFGLRDITTARAAELTKKLWEQDEMKWHKMTYGTTEDELALVELKNFGSSYDFIKDCTPPTEGSMFFYLTAAAFEVYKTYWERAEAASLKSKEDRFRRDVLALAHEAKITLLQETDGSFVIVLHPKVTDVDAVEKQVTASGEKAGMSISFAPGLFS